MYKNFNLIKHTKKDLSIRKKIFEQICKIRFFELEVRKNKEKGIIKNLIYLCLGQEAIYAAVAAAFKKANVFIQHRGHGAYLAYGGNEKKLRDELKGLKSGSNKGMGGSPPIADKSKKIFGHVGLIGDQVPVAAGYALVNKKNTVCFFGDGAAEEDYVLATFGFASHKKLKILFICDDNDMSVLTTTKVRRSWKLLNVAKSFGLKSFDITDDPITIYKTINKAKRNLPALINIRTCREYWHEGSGIDMKDKNSWNRYEIEKEFFEKKNINFVNKTLKHYKKWAENLWK